MLDEATILEACDRLIDFHAWRSSKIEPRPWLQNFGSADKPFALSMLSRFVFYSDELVDQLFASAFQDLSNRLRTSWQPFDTAKQAWRTFFTSAAITIVQGEVPNPSDSGWLFARKARQRVGVAETALIEPMDLVAALYAGFRGPVVFVDDFVGSGEQFIKTWKREFNLAAGGVGSFEQFSAANPDVVFCYCTAMITEKGRGRLEREAAAVVLSTGNTIPYSLSFTSVDSALWPTGMKDDGIAFIRRESAKLGFAAEDGGQTDWRGFHRLGLGLAFEHSVPDASLPLFYAAVPGWTPLVRRT